uniref:Uncharacterized protein n=1 Tax=Nelumbo nucifera TaxID=4432 RepID=A0A822YGF8_NELNU|nr:TPA_asm: hypothetical protein HUJ06_010084 [Nelumbo nucifera]
MALKRKMMTNKMMMTKTVMRRMTVNSFSGFNRVYIMTIMF